MSNHVAIRLQQLSKNYRIYAQPVDRLKQAMWRGKRQYFKEFTALKPMDLTINRGEVLGIVGRNGSGKSTLLQLICGTLQPTTGSVEAHGRISALLELGAGFNPEFTGKENVYLNAAILGLSQAEIDEKYDAIVEFAAIGEHIHQPVKSYSSGMYVRLAFSVAVATQPDILVVDEALAVGDEVFQRKCYARIMEMQSRGATILFVSHSANKVIEMCDRTILLDDGEFLMDGMPKKVLAYYHKLIFASPEAKQKIRREIVAEKGGEARACEPLADGSQVIAQESFARTHFDPNMKPETTFVHMERGVDIVDYGLYDHDNNQVNYVELHQLYTIRFTVKFMEKQEKVRFNYRIKNLKGMVIGGNNSHQHDEELVTVKADVEIAVEMDFICTLLPDSYFITLGCSGNMDEGKEPLQRVDDALMFKVLPREDGFAAGVVDFHKAARIEVVG